MAKIGAFVPVGEEQNVENQLADEKTKSRVSGGRKKSSGGGGKSKLGRGRGGGVRRNAGRGMQMAGASGQIASKAVELAGKGAQIAGKGTEKAGQGMVKAGSKLSTTGIGAIVGVPLAAVGGVAIGAGKGAEVAGKGAEKAGQMGGKASKGLKDKGKGLKQSGQNAGGNPLNLIKGDKKNAGDGFSVMGLAGGIAKKAAGNSPLTSGILGGVLGMVGKMIKKIVGFGSKNLLRLAWILIPFTLGLSVAYIIFHGFASCIFGRKMFCRLGEEWPGGGMAASLSGGIAGLSGSGNLSKLSKEISSSMLGLVEWLIVAIIAILVASFWLLLWVIFLVITETLAAAWGFLSNISNILYNGFLSLFNF